MENDWTEEQEREADAISAAAYADFLAGTAERRKAWLEKGLDPDNYDIKVEGKTVIRIRDGLVSEVGGNVEAMTPHDENL